MRFQLSLRRLNAVFSAGTVRGTASSAAMRLVQFCHRGGEGGVRVGVEQAEGQGVIDLKAFDPSMPSTMRQFLEMGQEGMDCAKRALSSGQHMVAWSDIRLLSPVTGPEKVVCVGMNYKDHCLEQNAPIPEEPIIFSKFPSSITGPSDDILLPEESQEDEALSYVAGFTVANDVSARDWQMKRNGKQWLLGKTFDTFCPLGPALVSTAALKDVHNLGIRCLRGDVVECQIDEIGSIRNTVM
ncbi:hypothetical protein cypCar_00026449 [Cyprinus carpio]|nr:hypothetical protein cypCar_00026449 [Cyprinus carpio]